MAIVSEELFINHLARWLHARNHKGSKAWYCESDRTQAEAILQAITDWGWAVHEDDGSS